MGIKNVGNPEASFRGKFEQTTQGRPSFTPTPPGSAAPTPPSPAPISASGGTTFTADGYSYHAFESNGTFTVSSGGPMEIEYFLVGGGGGGSDRGNGTGGGGAGGVLTNMPLGTTTPDAGHARLGNPNYYVSPGPYTVLIGAGGGAGSDNTGGQGMPTEFYSTPLGRNHPDGLKAIGGGFGGYSTAGGNGGCGGGADNNNRPDYQPVQGPQGKAAFYPGPFAQGFPGGDGIEPGNGGGGGAGGAGQNALPGIAGSYGGIGVKAPWCPPSFGQPGPSPGRWFAGGGGGGAGASGPNGRGGGPGGPYAGGGNGATQNGPNAGNGVANSGGGGGSGCDGNSAGEGGSGIVFIRYQN